MGAPSFLDEGTAQRVAREVQRGRCSVPPLPSRGSGLVVDFLPIHLRQIVLGVQEELDERALSPLAHAPDPSSALQLACGPPRIAFSEIYPAFCATLLPWVAEEPTRLQRLLDLAGTSDRWTEREVIALLGMPSCAAWAAAHDARIALARLVARSGVDESAPYLPAVGLHCLSADYGLLLGGYFIRQRLRPAPGIAEQFAELALSSAREAYALASSRLYEDAPADGAGEP